ncbi:hypothetical protein GEMRC1_009644 [Eukaryota sp. GEM-RC1]
MFLPNCIDIENGVFRFSAETFTKISAQELSSLHSLLKSYSFKELTLNKCQISDTAILVLCDIIRTYPSLTSVDFSHCRLLYISIHELINSIQSNSFFKIVNLSHNDIEFNTLLDIFKQFSPHQSPPIIEVLPHSIDFCRGIISYAKKVNNTDLRLLLTALKSNVPIKRVECRGLKTVSFEGIVTLFEILSINKSVVDIDVSPHCIDVENGVFRFSPETFTQISVEELSSLYCLLKSCSFTELTLKKLHICDTGISILCDIIKTCHSLTSVDFSTMRLLEQLSRCSSDFEYSHSSVDVFFDDDSSVYNKLTHDNFLQLFNALQSNTNLNNVNVNNLDIGFETLLTVFEQFSTHHSPPTIEVLPHSIDFSRGIISYDNKVTNTDLRLLLNALKSSVPIKRVQSNGIADLDFDTLLTIHQIYSINNSLIDVDISPHFIDTESGIFYFSPQDHTQITPEIVSDLQSLNIKNLGIHECYFVDDAFDSFCDLIRTSTSLTSLDLSDCYIHAYFLKLIDALQSNSKLNNVNLSNHSIGFRGLLTIFDLVSAGKLTSNIQFSPHSCDFSNGAICYDSHVGTADLCTLLSALKSNVPIKRVDCRGLKTLSFEGIITLFEILFIKKISC